MAVLDASGVTSAVETTTKTSRAAIERAVAAQGLKGKEKAGRVNAIMVELEAAGVVRTTTVESFRETA